MVTRDDSFVAWLSHAGLSQQTLTFEQLGVLRAAYHFRESCSDDYYSTRILSHVSLHANTGLKVAPGRCFHGNQGRLLCGMAFPRRSFTADLDVRAIGGLACRVPLPGKLQRRLLFHAHSQPRLAPRQHWTEGGPREVFPW